MLMLLGTTTVCRVLWRVGAVCLRLLSVMDARAGGLSGRWYERSPCYGSGPSRGPASCGGPRAPGVRLRA